MGSALPPAGPPLLSVEGLHVCFVSGGRRICAVNGVDLAIPAGTTVALVGESGSGKSVTALSLARLLPSPPAQVEGGRILFDGADVLRMSRGELTALRAGGIAYVFQDPANTLNPLMRVGAQIEEAFRGAGSSASRRAEGLNLLRKVELPDCERAWRAWPHELSGGMKQRVILAMALAARPRLLVADEPTTALDVTIQAQILAHLRDLRAEFGLTVLLITHNLGLVAGHAERVHVMYAGRVVESGLTAEVLRRPAHPYTRGLLDAVPSVRGVAAGRSELRGIPGTVPDPAALPPGCAFAARCSRARKACLTVAPAESTVSGTTGRKVRCLYPLPLLSKETR